MLRSTSIYVDIIHDDGSFKLAGYKVVAHRDDDGTGVDTVLSEHRLQGGSLFDWPRAQGEANAEANRLSEALGLPAYVISLPR